MFRTTLEINDGIPAPFGVVKPGNWCRRRMVRVRGGSTLRTAYLLAGVLLILAGAGCVRLGTVVETITLPPGTPSVESILAGLAENEDALRSFRAAGTIMVKIPEIEATQISRESSLHYQAPSSLNIVGRRYGTRGIELTYVDDAFLLEFPTRREYCFKETEAAFETISSADIVREMFRPEDWRNLSEEEVRITRYDEETQTVEAEVWEPGRRPWRRRVISVQGAPWVLLENILLGRDGSVIARTTKRAYHEQNGIRYPTEIECTFPGEEAWMQFNMRRVDINLDLDQAMFNLSGRVSALNRAGFARVDIFAGEGPSIEDLTESR